MRTHQTELGFGDTVLHILGLALSNLGSLTLTWGN